MSTNAIFQFRGTDGIFNVYMHWDGDTFGACSALKATQKLAWDAGRYESGEFAAAFIAANKVAPGNIRVLASGNAGGRGMDVDYMYQITESLTGFNVKARKFNYGTKGPNRSKKMIFEGPFVAFQRFTKKLVNAT